jgi:MFS transporter, ACS family, hexuronate transporter
MRFRFQLRWLAVGIFLVAGTINFLDRQLLAAVAPSLKAELHLTNAQYGGLISAYSVVYAIVAPAVGLFVDRVGLNAGMSLAVFLWSIAGMATGFSSTFRGLLACRMGLAVGESTGNSGPGKATAMYLDPGELAIAGGFGATSITLGTMAAPLVAAALAPHYGWRSVFIFCGSLGFLWIPLWWFTARRIPPRVESVTAPSIPLGTLLRDRRLWGVTLAYALVYCLYSLWANWTTVYFVHERHLTQLEANQHFAWFPPAFAIVGGFFGGGLAFRLIRRGMGGMEARMRACWLTAPMLLATAAVPIIPSTAMAAVAIGVSFLCLQSLICNIHVLPVDLYGAPRAAFTNSLSSSASYTLQALISPLIGWVVDRFGFGPVCVIASVLPLLGLWALQVSLSAKGSQKLVHHPGVLGSIPP